MSAATSHAAGAGEVSPQLLVDAVIAYQKTAAIKAAVGLDLFTAIADGADTSAALAQKCGGAARGFRILCDFLTVHQFLSKSGERYALTPSSRMFLDRRSPAYMGSIVDFLCGPENLALFLEDPVRYVRNGGSPGLANTSADNPIWVKFAEAMTPFVGPMAEGLAAEVAGWPKPPSRVLDIAAGHGLFGISIARAVPGAAVVAMDWRAVLALAERNAASAGVSARYKTLPGSAFEVDWGAGYDLVLLPNFLHHFDRETCAGLLRKARASLAPAGRVVAVEFVPNEDRVSPPLPAAFAFIMLATTPKGDAFPPSALAEMARDAGFRDVSVKPMPPTPASLVLFED